MARPRGSRETIVEFFVDIVYSASSNLLLKNMQPIAVASSC